jgi:hypothetical protein
VARWQDVVDSAPEFAAAAQAIFGTGKHKTMASIRRNGSPRISAVEMNFADGEVWLGMMIDSVKAKDLLQDPRLALHSPSIDPPEDQTIWLGDAKLSGRAVEEHDMDRLNAMGGTGEGHLFRIDIEEVVVTKLGGTPPDHLVIELWRPGRSLKSTKRY